MSRFWATLRLFWSNMSILSIHPKLMIWHQKSETNLQQAQNGQHNTRVPNLQNWNFQENLIPWISRMMLKHVPLSYFLTLVHSWVPVNTRESGIRVKCFFLNLRRWNVHVSVLCVAMWTPPGRPLVSSVTPNTVFLTYRLSWRLLSACMIPRPQHIQRWAPGHLKHKLDQWLDWPSLCKDFRSERRAWK